MDIQDNLAKNLVHYRKALGLTQAQLAEKLNYSDKAVSKWERGESVPDLFVVKQIADFYHVKIDTLLDTPKEEKPKIVYNISRRRLILSLTAFVTVWLIALLAYAVIDNVINFEHKWMVFIYATFIGDIVLLTLSGVWGKNFLTTLFVSFLIWSFLICIFLTLKFTLTYPPKNLWSIFLVGIPLQILAVLWFFYKKVK